MSSAVSAPIKPVATIFCSAGSVILTSLCRSGVVRCVYRVLAEHDDQADEGKSTKTIRAAKESDWTTAMAYIRTHETKRRARGKPVRPTRWCTARKSAPTTAA